MSQDDDTDFIYPEDNREGPRRRSGDKIPSAYKLWMQTALNNMQTPPQMIDDIKKAIQEANETLIHKINNSIQTKVGEVQIDLEQYKTKQVEKESETKERLAAMESQSKTLKWVVGIGIPLLALIFTIISIYTK